MKMMSFLACLLLMVGTCAAEEKAPRPKKAVAVTKLTAREGSGANAREVDLLHDEIVNLLVNSRKFTIVEREQIGSVLKEQELVSAGLTDGEGPESNKLKAAGYIIDGAIQRAEVAQVAVSGYARYDAKVEVLLKFVNAESGAVEVTKKMDKSASVTVSTVSSGPNVGKDVLSAAVKKLSRDIVNAFVEMTYPAKVLLVSKGQVVVNLTAEQAKVGTQYDVFLLGEELVDEDTGESLGSDEERVGRVIVAVTKPKFSKCDPVGGLDLGKVKKGMILREVDEEQETPSHGPSLGDL